MKSAVSWAGFCCLFLMALSFSGCGGDAGTGKFNEFSADMVESSQGISLNSKIYVKGNKYRIEQTQEGQLLLIIVDQDAGKTQVVMPSQEQYAEINTTDPVSLMNDPYQSYKYVSANYERRGEGTESISGYECEKSVYSQQDLDIMTAWYTDKLSLPVRIILHTDRDHTIELQNINTDSVNEELFQVPENYTRLVVPGEQPLEIPEWAKQYESFPVIAAPVENKAMKTGEGFRVKIIPETALKITGFNTGQVRAAFTAVPFKDGLPIKDPATSSIGFAEFGMGGGFTFEETLYEADEIVVHIDEGDINISVEKITVGPGREVAEGRVYGLTILPNREIKMRFLNLNDGESQCVIVYSRNGVELEERTVGPESQRTIFFNRLYESRERSITLECDAIEVRVTSGKMLVSIRQP